jgi:hypothetical protein
MKLKIKFTNVPKPALPASGVAANVPCAPGQDEQLPLLSSSFSSKRKLEPEAAEASLPPLKRPNSVAATTKPADDGAPPIVRAPSFKFTIKRPDAASTPKVSQSQQIAQDVFNMHAGTSGKPDREVQKQQAKVRDCQIHA